MDHQTTQILQMEMEISKRISVEGEPNSLFCTHRSKQTPMVILHNCISESQLLPDVSQCQAKTKRDRQF